MSAVVVCVASEIDAFGFCDDFSSPSPSVAFSFVSAAAFAFFVGDCLREVGREEPAHAHKSLPERASRRKNFGRS